MKIPSVSQPLPLFLANAVLVAVGCTPSFNQKEEKSASSYSVGYALGQQLAKVKTELNTDAASIGFVDGINGAAKMELQAMQTALSALQDKRQGIERNEGEKRHAEAKAFIEKMQTQPTAKVIQTGLVMIETRASTAAKPKLTDASELELRYTAKTMAGTVFDQSPPNGTTVQVKYRDLLPGVKRALREMPIGAQATIHIAPELAFAGSERPGVPAFSALTYDIEFVSAQVAATEVGSDGSGKSKKK